MTTEGMHRRHLLLHLGALTGYLLLGQDAEAAEPLAVIVPKASWLSGVSLQELRRVYQGELDSLGGRRVLPLNQPPRTEVRERFDRSVLKMNAEEVARYWIDRRIRGRSGAPKSVPTRLMAPVVAKLPNSVGYVTLSAVNAGVKILPVDGRLPGEPGYRLT
ncbi:MAG: hypothetical protein SFV15_00165 [Polyangiaceae bacterium]|nr:hypothetical protein [Polyangiaceae bacterium]